MARSWSHRRLLTLLVLLIPALILAGCESDDEQSRESVDFTPVGDDSAGGESTPAAGATEDQEVLTVEPDPEGDEDEHFPVTVTGSAGTEVTLDERPERIVSLSPGATETFFAIDAGDQLAAVDMFSDYPEEASELPQIDAYQPDPEEIVDLDPDVVFVIFDTDGLVETLEDLDVSVLFLEAPTSVDETLEQIRTMGELTGETVVADEVADSLEERVDEITSRVESVDESPRVYHELDEMHFTVGPDSFVGDLYNLLGAENIAEGAEGEYPQLSEEIILEEDPEVIILPDDPDAEGVTPEDVRERDGWEDIDAVENDRIYEIDADIVSRPGPRIVDALEQLAEMLYPEEFESSHESHPAQADNPFGAAAA